MIANIADCRSSILGDSYFLYESFYDGIIADSLCLVAHQLYLALQVVERPSNFAPSPRSACLPSTSPDSLVTRSPG